MIKKIRTGNENRELNLLYVDDNADDRQLFAKAMDRIDVPFVITYADWCDDMFHLLDKGNHFDLILVDVNLTGVDGNMCLKLLKANKFYKAIPVVILSNSISRKDTDEAYADGAHFHIVKPVALSNFVVALEIIFEVNWREKQKVLPKEEFLINIGYNIQAA